jgi:hypothetical protein
MKRFKIIKDFIACLKDNDIAIFSGHEMCKEAFALDRPGNLYIMNAPGITVPLALGIAMNSNKRVFVFSGDGDFLMEMGAYAQTAVSRCKNIFCVILDNDCYQSAGGHPTIFRSLNSPTGVLFNLGFTFLNYTHHFIGKISVPFMTKKIGNLVGPVSILIEVDKGLKSGLKEVSISNKDNVKRISDLIKNEEIGTSLYVPPYSLNFFDVNTNGGE